MAWLKSGCDSRWLQTSRSENRPSGLGRLETGSAASAAGEHDLLVPSGRI